MTKGKGIAAAAVLTVILLWAVTGGDMANAADIAERLMESTESWLSTEVFSSELTEIADSEEEKRLETDENWENKMIPLTSDGVEIYEEGTSTSEIVGWLYGDDIAEIRAYGETWSLIQSGNVTGFIETEKCLIGEEARRHAETHYGWIAVVQKSGLRLRKAPNTDSDIREKLQEGTRLQVVVDPDVPEEWLKVRYHQKEGYVSRHYVAVSINVGTGVTVKEDARKMTDYTDDERELLAAIIDCEAGNGNYEGMVAVGSVIMNRVASKYYPDNIMDVIYQKHQFEPVSSGSLEKKLKSKKIPAVAYDAADAVLAGERNTECLCFWADYTGHEGTLIGDNIFFDD